MKSQKEIPAALLSELKERKISTKDVLVFAHADMNLSCEFQSSFLFLLQDRLLMAVSAAKNKDRVLSGRGFDRKRLEVSNLEWYTFPLKNIKNPAVTRLVVGGVLHFEKDGVDTAVAAFTNTYAKEMWKLVDIIKKLESGEDITEEMLKDEQKDEFCEKCSTPFPEKERRVCVKCLDKRAIFFRLFEYFMPYKFRMLTIALLCIFVALMGALWPLLSGVILYDRVLAGEIGFLYGFGITDVFLALALLALTMFVVHLLEQLSNILHMRLTAVIVPNVVRSIKEKVFASLQKLSVGFFSSRQTGGLMTRVIDDANEVTTLFIDGLPYIIPHLMTIVFASAVMFVSNWQLALATVALFPILVFLSVKMYPLLHHLYSKRYQTIRRMRSHLNDNITGARVVKAFGQEEEEIQRFGKINSFVYNAQMDVATFDVRFNALYDVIFRLSFIIVWGLGAFFVLNFFSIPMTFGTLITFAGYVTMLRHPLDFFSFIFRWWSASMNSAQRIFEIVDTEPDIVERKNTAAVDRLKGDIKLNNVTFGYVAGKDVLKDINLEVPAGQMLGIVGKSGAGKSTLVNLISRLYDVGSGEILLDNINVKDMAFADVRRSIAMVSQETYIFSGTIFENIAYGTPDCTREDVVAAAVAASAHDFICKLPDGYDTVVGHGGRDLSGGERQRVSIARAILINPRILILDEATAAVDTETERNIQASLDCLIKGRTTISIAHRISTLRNADCLVVIEDGKITESGTHKELIEKKGTYLKLLQIQTKALAMRGIE